MRSPHQRITKDLAALDAAEDALSRLDAGRRLREHAEALETDLVLAAREAGASWSKIGKLYGMSKQGAQQRFRRPDVSRKTQDSSQASPA